MNCSLQKSSVLPSGWPISALPMVALTLSLWFHCSASAFVRIESLTDVEGVRVNQLSGMGLVTGLNGTGGKSPVTRQFAQNMLQNFGIRASPTDRLLISQDTRQRTDNLSVVTVTANLPIFAREGSHIDITVAAFDDASSLLGGTLIMTPLFGADGRVYAVASGSVQVGGFSAGGDAANVQKNHPTTGRVANGATVEAEVPSNFLAQSSFRLLLRHSSFQNSQRIANAINQRFPGVAKAEDAGAVNIIIPNEYRLQPVRFVSAVRALQVDPDLAAKVVINERTGTVVIGQSVRISAVAISHGNLSIVTSETPEVSQPNPASNGETVVVPRTQVDVFEEEKPVFVIGPTTTVGELATALNELGVTPRDLSAIFQQLHSAEALHAKLVFE